MNEKERGRGSHGKTGFELAVVGLLVVIAPTAYNVFIGGSYWDPTLPWYVTFGCMAVGVFMVGAGFYIRWWGGRTVSQVAQNGE